MILTEKQTKILQTHDKLNLIFKERASGSSVVLVEKMINLLFERKNVFVVCQYQQMIEHIICKIEENDKKNLLNIKHHTKKVTLKNDTTKSINFITKFDFKRIVGIKPLQQIFFLNLSFQEFFNMKSDIEFCLSRHHDITCEIEIEKYMNVFTIKQEENPYLLCEEL